MKSPFLTVAEYKEKYLSHLDKISNTVKYYNSMTGNIDGCEISMLKFHDAHEVPGGAWPGGFGRFKITD